MKTKTTTSQPTKGTKKQHCICKLRVVQGYRKRHGLYSRIYVSTFNICLFCISIIGLCGMFCSLIPKLFVTYLLRNIPLGFSTLFL